MDTILRMDRMPHIWCPGCGLGAVLSAFAGAIDLSGLDRKRVVVVSGIGCTGRSAGYLHVDGFHTTHGRAIPFATGLHLVNPNLKVVVISGDGDLVAIGGNHLIHAARRNLDITVICVNNFIYGMTGGQVAPTTPVGMRSTTTPSGAFEPPFNIPHLVASAGASFVARWTTLHSRRMRTTFARALTKKGFSFVEVLSPCPPLYMRRNKLGAGLNMLQRFQRDCVIKHGADPADGPVDVEGPILVGRFVDKERPTYVESYEAMRERRIAEHAAAAKKRAAAKKGSA